MKITRFVISDYHQFGYLNIDLTYPKGHPKEGKPLEKVCFIGKNGTGKTSILKFIKNFYNQLHSSNNNIVEFDNINDTNNNNSQICFEVEHNNNRYLIGKLKKFHVDGEFRSIVTNQGLQILKSDYYDNIPDFFEKIFFDKNADLAQNVLHKDWEKTQNDDINKIIKEIQNNLLSIGLLIYSPTEYNKNDSLTDIFSLTNLDIALRFGKNFPYYHEISFDHVMNFWSALTYQVNRREQEFKDFLNKSENQKKAVEDVKKIFEKENPDILKVIADKWNFILQTAGLYFDYDNAKKPIQLTDNLIAYIKTIKDNKEIKFHDLSSGIKNLIFNVGYLVSLYFHRDVKSAVALFDEPEFSLFPDILLKLIDFYTNPKDFPNTQFFFATHSPLVASQFEPEERICLHFDENRRVTYSPGIAPLGDNPDDILLQDFGMSEVMPEFGVGKWNEYLKLRSQIDKEKDLPKKQELMKQFSELRRQYRFQV
jgi:hemerythrin-like domain-containing protein